MWGRWARLWRREAAACDDAVRAAEELRDRAVEQNRRAQAIVPRVDAATARRLAPMIENVLRSVK